MIDIDGKDILLNGFPIDGVINWSVKSEHGKAPMVTLEIVDEDLTVKLKEYRHEVHSRDS